MLSLQILGKLTKNMEDSWKMEDEFNKSDANVKGSNDVANPEGSNSREDKDVAMSTGDLCDLTFSSFNDILLGDCPYFEDVSVSDCSNNVSEKLESAKQLHKNSLAQENLQAPNIYEVDSKKDAVEDNFNFYHILEVIQDPVDEKHDQKNLNNMPLVKCKLIKNSRHKKKRKIVTGIIRKGQRYLPNFKQKVLDYASGHTFKATALHFNINCNTITEWARERKRLPNQQKSTTSVLDSVCHYKTELVDRPSEKTDIILNDSFTIETEINGKVLKTTEQDLPLGDMRSDERFIEWAKKMRKERRELSRSEVFSAAQSCLKKFRTSEEHPIWFMLWVKRYERLLDNSEKSDHETEKYIMYPNNFKLEVVSYAKLFTKNSAARVFNVPRRRIFDWFKYSDASDDKSPSPLEKDALKVTLTRDKSKREIYSELHEWYQKRFVQGFSPSSSEIKAKAKELFNANGIGSLKFSEGWLQKFCKRLNIKLRHNDDDHLLLWILTQFDNNVSLSHQEITDKSSKLVGKGKSFKGSKGWTLRFLKRHSNFLQQVPTIYDKLPDMVQSEITNFYSSFRYTQNSNKINSSSIGCMDEIPIAFNYPQDGKTTNLPLLRKTGFENCQAVVILCMLADGRMLPPTVILRGNGPKHVVSDGNVDLLILYQEKGIVDVEIVENWVVDVWLSFVSSPSVLILDSFKPHCSHELKERLAKRSSVLSIIPEGCSSQLQPLDVEITPKFKELIKKHWKESSANEVQFCSRIGKGCRFPDQGTILDWIRKAHRKLEEYPYSIINSFKVVGLID